MITLITGEPGNGKTAYVVNELLKETSGRELYVWGIPELLIEHEKCPPRDQWSELEVHPDDPTVTRPRLTFPDGALIVVDEAQDVFRPRSPGSRVPDVVAALETHRHKGHDLILITQRAIQIDSGVRALVGRHIHVYRSWAGRRLYEWPTCRDPGSSTDRSAAITRPYTLPSAALSKYKSATMHIKPKHKMPYALVVVGVAIAVSVVGGYVMWGRLYGTREPVEAPSKAGGVPDRVSLPPPGGGQAASGGSGLRYGGSTYVQVGSRVLVSEARLVNAQGEVVARIGGESCDFSRSTCRHQGELVKR